MKDILDIMARLIVISPFLLIASVCIYGMILTWPASGVWLFAITSLILLAFIYDWALERLKL